MNFIPYEDVPLFLASEGQDGSYIFAETASLSVKQPLSPSRQLDDNLLGICSYNEMGDMNYTPQTFVANQNFFANIGPIGGPPKPLATSIQSIPADTEITFPNGKHLYFQKEYKPNGHDYIVSLL